jgi:hypothetical protein
MDTLSLRPDYMSSLADGELNEIIIQSADELAPMVSTPQLAEAYEEEITHTRSTMRNALYERYVRSQGYCKKCGGHR